MRSEGETYKIGLTCNSPENRRKQLQTGSSEKLSLVCSFKTSNASMLERLLHKKFANKRTIGEWFSLDAEDVIDFTETCKTLEITIKMLEEQNHFIKQKYNN